jgi:hypothetical protein
MGSRPEYGIGANLRLAVLWKATRVTEGCLSLVANRHRVQLLG